ncbi:DNA-3-methyladenine glycosylase family protein [Planctomicrobium piriforme]|uniref:DNA-3-methyladenine glycosylase II n=1 Tax=Planctomicrobium piriforme TaxID=1576369 RepID=A0A1I3I7V8_9PLAN|nr:DNA-3-methyladenine glycosylase [Planctomicrobium piriforme]SFI43947.1 DNA-3-methyladenine glycosylase II [Planctomicrobium piriforme]
MSLDPQTVARALRHLRKNDPVLRNVIAAVGPFGLKRQTNRYESLLRAIVSQQISGAAAKSIWAKLELAAGRQKLTATAIHAVSDEALRAAGLSPQKLRYVRDLTERVHAGGLPLHSLHRKSDDDVILALTEVKGIGVWTAQMFLMFSLGRPDVLPHGDLGIQSAIRRLYGLDALPDLETCQQVAAPWRPYATYACWYLWRSGDLKQIEQITSSKSTR